MFMIRRRYAATAASLLALGLAACATSGTTSPSQPAAKPVEKAEAKPLPKGLDGQASSGFPSTYQPLPSRPTAYTKSVRAVQAAPGVPLRSRARNATWAGWTPRRASAALTRRQASSHAT